jgi:hypothetical protein
MRIAAYTSCAVNYYAKACALLESIQANSPDTSLTLCLCDRGEGLVDPAADGFARCWSPFDLGYDPGWVFRHNVMELCTGVKGRALKRLMAVEPADLYVYLDPDVFVYNDLAEVLGYMDGGSIGLVPHILSPEDTAIGVQLTELSTIKHGIYNLGHLFVAPDDNGRALADWWSARLDAYCHDDVLRGLFTDQRWMDLVPAAFDGVKVLRTPNLDVASWNIARRRIAQKGDSDRSFEVDGLPLITYHFSGTGPTGVHRRIREIFAPCSGAMAEIERRYEAAIARHGQRRLASIPPFHDFFDDGTPIPAEARRVYRDSPELRAAFPDPYATMEGGYADWLKEHRPELTQGFVIPEFRLEKAFDDLFHADYYLERYPDAAALIGDGVFDTALEHYVEIGSLLLYDPNPFFVSRYYLEKAGAVEAHRLRALPRSKSSTLLWHYLAVGLRNGHEPVEYFDSNYYLGAYPDLAKAFRLGLISSPLAHVLDAGARENRSPGPGLPPDTMAYLVRQGGGRANHAKGAFGALVDEGRVAGRGVGR